MRVLQGGTLVNDDITLNTNLFIKLLVLCLPDEKIHGGKCYSDNCPF